MKKIVLMAVLYTLFSFNALYPANEETEAQFFLYIGSGNIEEVSNYIDDKKININAKLDDGMTPLILSIVYKQDEIAKMLIEKKADVNIKLSLNENGIYMKNFTPLILNEDKEVAQSLISAGADINIKLTAKYPGQDIKLENATPLMWFILNDNTEIAELLIESGADINAKDKSGKTALYYAKEKNNTKIEELLITKGAK